jgi:DNA-directed RNA polymerase subunit RPC12/RpoP
MTFYDDINRGCLENGEPLEAQYGTGWWTPMPEQEQEYYGSECPFCGAEAWYCYGAFINCEKCGKTYEDIESEERNEMD